MLRCQGAIDRAELGNLTPTLANIEPAIQMVSHTASDRTSSNTEFVDKVVEADVRKAVSDILSRSAVISGLVNDGELMVAGVVYDLESGLVNWLY